MELWDIRHLTLTGAVVFLAIEAGLTVLVLVLAFAVPNLGSRWFEAIERSFGKLAQRRGLSVIVVGLTALALRAALLPILPIPEPLISDGFSYLLGADTFAHGRLTNPTPPVWTHFESLMIIMKPTYNSKYPPAQSLFLAVGQVLLGHPFWGAWLTLGLMCGAICWMLQAWVGEGWALLGGFLAVIRIGAFSYWANSYWGGAVAALGGALAIGALPRLKQGNRVRNALLMGLGLAILANSRPYEGLIFSLPITVALIAWMLGRQRPPFSVSLRRVVLPLCLLLGLTGAWMGYYNWRVTGNSLRMPYQVYQAQYDPTPYFLWQHEKPLPTYRHLEMETWEKDVDLGAFLEARSLSGLARNEMGKLLFMWQFYLGPLLTLCVLIALASIPYGFSWRDITPPTGFLLLASGVSIVGVALEVFFSPQYAAPMTCLIFALVLLAMHRLRGWCPHGKPRGLFLVRLTPTFTILLLLLRACAGPLHLRVKYNFTPWGAYSDAISTVGRSQVIAELRRQLGRQLVIVQYWPAVWFDNARKTGIWGHAGVSECVYNSADMEDQKIVWAHDMGPAQNRELIDYYKRRRVWLLYADEQPPKLVPYTEAADRSPVTEVEKTP